VRGSRTSTKLHRAAQAIAQALEEAKGQPIPRKDLVWQVARQVRCTPRTVELVLTEALGRQAEGFGNALETVPLKGRGNPVAYRLVSAKQSPTEPPVPPPSFGISQPSPLPSEPGQPPRHPPHSLLPKEFRANAEPDPTAFAEIPSFERIQLIESLLQRVRGRLSPEDVDELERNLVVLSLAQLQGLAAGRAVRGG